MGDLLETAVSVHQDPYPPQVSCFGPDGLLRRHDFTIDILGRAPRQLYATDYRDVGGIIIPTTRPAWQDDNHVPELAMIAIDMREIAIR
jgi:hypothetical protein